jgi:hypothetical protein
MIYEILLRSGAPPLIVSMKRVRVPAASVPPGRPAMATPGMLVSYDDRHVGRVLGRIEAPTENQGWLFVLQLGSTADFACLRSVDPATVHQCRPNPSRFARWFFQSRLPAPDLVAHLATQGALSEAWIDSPALREGTTAGAAPRQPDRQSELRDDRVIAREVRRRRPARP